MKNNELQIILDEQNVSKENAKQLLEAFGAPFTEAGELLVDYITEDDEGNPTLTLAESAIRVTDEEDFAAMAEAREKRIKLMHIRTGVEGKRKELKEDSLRVGRAIDAAAKAIKTPVKIVEEYLETQEKFAERLAEKRRLLLIESRGAILQKYVDRPDLYKFEDLTDDVFDKLVSDLKRQKFEREEAERIAEEERLAAIEAEKKRQAEIEAENERLRKEAEARELREAIMRDRINRVTALGLSWDGQQYSMDDFNVDIVEIETLSDKTFTKMLVEISAEMTRREEAAEKKLAEERAAAEAAQKAKDEELRIEREKRAEIERKQSEEAEAAAKAKTEAEEKERQALLAPDKEKLLTFSNALETIRVQKLPAVKTKQAQDVVNLIDEMLTKMRAIIAEKAEKL